MVLFLGLRVVFGLGFGGGGTSSSDDSSVTSSSSSSGSTFSVISGFVLNFLFNRGNLLLNFVANLGLLRTLDFFPII